MSIAFFVPDGGEHAFFAGLEIILQLRLKLLHPLDRDLVEVAVLHRPEDGDLLFDRNRVVLRLLEQLHDALAAIELRLGGGIEVGTELGEGGQLAELRQVDLDLARRPASSP